MATAQSIPNPEGKKIQSLEGLIAYRQEILSRQDPQRPLLVVCHGTGCLANGSAKVSEALRKAVAKAGIPGKVMVGIKTTGCHGFCSRGPLVIVKPAGIFYQRVKPGDAEEIVQSTLIKGETIERLLYHDPHSDETIPLEKDIPFYRLQQRVVLRNIGKVDPTDIEDTIAAGGYAALAKALTAMTPEEIISAVENPDYGGGGAPVSPPDANGGAR